MKRADWESIHHNSPEKLAIARRILDELRRGRELRRAVLSNTMPDGGQVAKDVLVFVYRQMVESGEWPEDPALLARIRLKPVRSLSGVATVTVLTRPYPCPGDCIFCPTDAEMPKSYLPDEPAAARAHQNHFDPFAQVASRLKTLNAVGHPTDKMELLILGGSWTAYPRAEQEWFVRRCFDAFNGQDSETLEEAQRLNEEAAHRNVGLVIETRPDEITPDTLAWLRRLGVTKVQMGAQSLDDTILALNHRGHQVQDTLDACALLRAAGFKIVLHWMPNLLGATPASDRADFARLWLSQLDGLGLCPDELKIYPTQLLANAPLYAFWQRGEYKPYTTQELIDLIADIKPSIPPYCRVNRVIRDIPSLHVVEGNKTTSLRQDVVAEMQRRGQVCNCIRCREVRNEVVDAAQLHLSDEVYYPLCAEEHFLSYVSPHNKLAGYLRLSLPQKGAPDLGLADLKDAAIIREVHVYGQALAVGSAQSGAAQHSGLGAALIEESARIARQQGFKKLAVIAAVGTRRYYAVRGFDAGDLYMVRLLA